MLVATLKPAEEQPSTAYVAGVKAIAKAKLQIRKTKTCLPKNFKEFNPPMNIDEVGVETIDRQPHGSQDLLFDSAFITRDALRFSFLSDRANSDTALSRAKNSYQKVA
jgi:hypothetical protein